jgi:hypothetical protein
MHAPKHHSRINEEMPTGLVALLDDISIIAKAAAASMPR